MWGKKADRISMADAIIESNKRYCERIKYYKDFGYDIKKEIKFILEKSYPIYGDILDVGTGKGYFALELAKEGYSFTSIDISAEEQELAKLNIKYFNLEKQINFRIENAENLSFEDSSFDIIFSINAIHHFSNPIKAIDELIRMITFEGKMILSDFTKEGLEIMDRIHKAEGRHHAVGRVGLSEITKYLQGREFKIEKHMSKFQEIVVAYHSCV